MARVVWKGEQIATEKLKKVFNGLINLGYQIEADAKRACTVDTGRLRASISTNWNGSELQQGQTARRIKDERSLAGKTTAKQTGLTATDGVGKPSGNPLVKPVVVVGTNVEYASHVEYGTSKMKPKPFLRVAWDMNIGKVMEFIK